MLIFVSYARRDHAAVRSLAERLRLLHHEVWLDDELSGGQVWWDRILASVRECDLLLFALSPGALESEACTLERQYAEAVGKPVLPVMVQSVPAHLLPPDLAVVQFVDYTAPGEEAAFRLIGALSTLPAAAPPPDPLPTPPPVPISYLSDISRRVHAPSLTLDEQLALVARLKLGLQRSEDQEATLGLLAKLRQRDDLYYAAARELERLQTAPDDGSDAASTMSPVQLGQAGAVQLTEDGGGQADEAGDGQAGTAPAGPRPAARAEREMNLEELRKAIAKFENGMYDGQKAALQEMVTGGEELLALCRCGFPEDSFRYVALLLTSEQLIWCRQLFASVRKGSIRWDQVEKVGSAPNGFSITTRDGSTSVFIALSKSGTWFGGERKKFGHEPVRQLVEQLVAGGRGQAERGADAR